MFEHAKPTKDQKYACHRDILADLIIEYVPDDPLLNFEKRKDIDRDAALHDTITHAREKCRRMDEDRMRKAQKEI